MTLQLIGEEEHRFREILVYCYGKLVAALQNQENGSYLCSCGKIVANGVPCSPSSS